MLTKDTTFFPRQDTGHHGVNLRTYIATQVMSERLSRCTSLDAAAKQSVEAADALIKALNQTPPRL